MLAVGYEFLEKCDAELHIDQSEPVYINRFDDDGHMLIICWYPFMTTEEVKINNANNVISENYEIFFFCSALICH